MNQEIINYWNKFYKHYDSLVYSYLPLSSMFIFNIAIVSKLLIAKWQQKTGGGAGSVTLSKTSHSVTIMLVGICVLFAILTTPYAVMYNVSSNISSYSYAIWYQLVYINHSVNFLVYMVTNKSFRRELIKKLCPNLGITKVQPFEDSTAKDSVTKTSVAPT